jgi:hypothetical protein
MQLFEIEDRIKLILGEKDSKNFPVKKNLMVLKD